MKNKKNSAEVVKEVATEQIETVAVKSNETVAVESNVTVTEPKKLGRPSDPNSARQAKLKAMEERRAMYGGYVPLGRPAIADSARQIKLAEIAAKKADPNYVPQKGRPKMTEEQKAADKAKRQAAFEVWKANQNALNAAKIEAGNK